ncbi:MAG: DUF2971 domain-containing protein [Bacteroidota bacterium]|nr:DUF2971 domain-containing protein [Bacteroidota bacterium]
MNIILKDKKGQTFEYIGDEFGMDEKFEGSKPNYLFKYYPLNKYSIDALSKNYVYCSWHRDLNDTFDGSPFLLDIDYEIKKLYESNNLGSEKTIGNDFITEIFSKHGIMCMTENPKDLLMWAYYTSNRGFCLEFDVAKFENPTKGVYGPFPINYRDLQEKFKVNKNNLHPIITATLTTKSADWQHEKEWRFMYRIPE